VEDKEAHQVLVLVVAEDQAQFVLFGQDQQETFLQLV
jgi:hypothetical protein